MVAYGLRDKVRMEHRPHQYIGPLRIDFECVESLSPTQIQSLMRHIVGAPTPPGDSEVDPSGRGWVLYVGDEILTRDELTATIDWLLQFPGMRNVTYRSVASP
jgi:hypothetical protein